MPDRVLVLNVLRGLNSTYDHLRTWITRQRPFSSFLQVRDDFVLEEIHQGSRDRFVLVLLHRARGCSTGFLCLASPLLPWCSSHRAAGGGGVLDIAGGGTLWWWYWWPCFWCCWYRWWLW